MKQLFAQVYAPATLGQFLREFTGGHVAQLASVARAHLVNLVQHVPGLCCPGVRSRCSSTSTRCCARSTATPSKAPRSGTPRSWAAGLRNGLSSLATTICTRTGAPVLAELRCGRARPGSGRGTASVVAEAILLARACGATGQILLRGDCPYSKSPHTARLVARRVRDRAKPIAQGENGNCSRSGAAVRGGGGRPSPARRGAAELAGA